MDLTLRDRFLEKWNQYFGGGDLPIAFFYTNDPGEATVLAPSEQWRCIIRDLARARNGQTIAFVRESIGCGGGRHYAGFQEKLRPEIEHFLSCGIPGEMEGERYIKTPEMAAEAIESFPETLSEGDYLVFKRWDLLEREDDPQAVVFFATPDVLSGLFTLANFDEVPSSGIVAPFSSGCGAIVSWPLAERDRERPRAVLGMFDVSARPYLPADRLTFAVPMKKFVAMVDNMDESFLITESWKKVRDRIQRNREKAE